MRVIRQRTTNTGAAADPAGGRRRRPAAVVRGGALLGLVGLLGVGMAVGDRFSAEPAELSDGSAWVGDGNDLVRGSSITGRADAMVKGVLRGGGARIAQDGLDAIVVVNGEAFAMNSSTLEPTNRRKVQAATVPLTRGGHSYLVEAGLVTCVDPQTLSEVAGSIPTPASASAPAPAVVDAEGRLWLAMRRTGEIWRISDCVVDRRSASFPEGNDVSLTLAGGTPVLYDETEHRVSWLDSRSGETKGQATVPKGALLQGPSVAGDRVWLSGPGSTLTGVSREGTLTTIELSVEDLRRPEVVDGYVMVPSKEGQVAIVRAAEGEDPEEAVVTDLEAAGAGDFGSFVQDGQAWFTSPSSQSSGTIATDGEIQALIVEKEKLEKETVEVPEEPADVVPPPSTPPVQSTNPTPPPGTPPVTTTTAPRDPEGPPITTPTMVPATTSTTTTAPKVQLVTVADVRGRSPEAACAALAADGLACSAQEFDEPGTQLEQVTEQQPAPGTSVAPGTAAVVRFYAATTVPDVDGLTGQQACDTLAQYRLTCATSLGPATKAVRPNGVYSQSLAADTQAPAHGTVEIAIDNTVWSTVTNCRGPKLDDPEDTDNYRAIIVKDQACPNGWEAYPMGIIANSDGPGRVAINHWVNNAANLADETRSHAERITRITEPAPDDTAFEPPVVLGFGYLEQITEDAVGVLPVFGAAPAPNASWGSFLHVLPGHPVIVDRPYAGVAYENPVYFTYRTL